MRLVSEAFVPESGVSVIPFFAFREVLPAGGRRTHRLNVPGKEAVFRFKGISLFEFLACNARDRRAELQADGAMTGKSL